MSVPPYGRSYRALAWVLGAAAVAACAGPPTAYVPAETVLALPDADGPLPNQINRYGYSDHDVKDSVIRVSFRGNSSTPLIRAMDFVLLRAAEVSLERGYPYFIVLERLNTSAQYTSTHTTPGMPMTTCDKDGHCTTTYGPSTTTSMTSIYPAFDYIVEMLTEAPSDPTIFALEAAFVRRVMRSKYALVAP